MNISSTATEGYYRSSMQVIAGPDSESNNGLASVALSAQYTILKYALSIFQSELCSISI